MVMQKLFNYRIQTDILLRAVAITLVVFHHMYSGRGRDDEYLLIGGTTVLMLLSGYNFSRFMLASGDPKQIVQSMWRFMWQIFWPAMALILLLFALKREFVWTEFLFISHWFTADSFFSPFMPYWYIQVMLQIFLGLMVLFSLPVLRDVIVRHLYVSSLVILLLAIGISAVFPYIWDTSHLYNWLPHLQLWNFVIGWFIHACLERARGANGWMYRLAATIMLLIGIFSVLWEYWGPFTILAIGGLMMCWLPSLPIPKFLARPVLLCSQAIFPIYLLHTMMPAFSERTLGKIGIDQPLLDGVLVMAGCIGLWAVCTAAQRAFRALVSRREESLSTPKMLFR